MNAAVSRPHPFASSSAPLIAADPADFIGVEILSERGVYAAGPEEKKLLCFLSDGRLMVADGQLMNPHVVSYCARLEKMGQPFHIVPATIQTIADAYLANPSAGGARAHEHSMMQVTAKELLARGCREHASDIHLRVRKACTEIHFRIHNDLIKVGEQTREYGERLLATFYGTMASVADNTYKPTERQDASIASREKLPSMLYGARIATAPTSDGSVMVLRLLYNDAGAQTDLRELGYSEAHAATIQLLKEQPIGINIISGPTGSGKSTTLQRTLAGEIAESNERIHVLTVEDPVEYPIEGAVQTAVTNAATEEERSRLFSAAIANAMRLDPNTIMIGEIRDRASGQNALRAAMTGHQVWSTLHANSALAIVDRLTDLGLPLNLVADHAIVTGLISQRLVKVLCPHCRKSLIEHRHEVSEAVLARVRQAVGAAIDKVNIAGPGCDACRHLGTAGRTVVAEIIVPDAQFFELVRAGEKVKALKYWRNTLGGKTLLEHTIEKIAAGNLDPRMAEKIVGHLSIESRAAANRVAPLEAIRAI